MGAPLQGQHELVEALNVAGIEAFDHAIMGPVGFMEATRSALSSVKRSWRKVRRLPAPAAA